MSRLTNRLLRTSGAMSTSSAIPRLTGREVPAEAPRHELVGEPLLGAGQVAIEQPGGHRLEFGEERIGTHGPQPTYR